MGRVLTFSSLCSAPDCSRPRVKRQWCNAHYIRWRRYGDPLEGARARRPDGLTEAETFAWFMPGDPPPSDQCWDWPAATVKGYGVLKGDQGLVYAHRVSYQIHHGPTGKEQVLHSCDRPICVQPAHLSLGGPPDNLRQAAERARMPRGGTASQRQAHRGRCQADPSEQPPPSDSCREPWCFREHHSTDQSADQLALA